MIQRFLPLAFMMAAALSVAAATDQTPVFVSGADGYHTYRIPSVIKTQKGAVIAVCEGRRTGGADAGEIDLVEKTSKDDGKTWGSQQVIWHDGPNTCGNPCMVEDASTGTIWLLSTHNLGSDKESAIETGKSAAGRTVWVFHSENDGTSWSQPREITADVKDPHWDWYATGPGIGIQIAAGLHKGRIVIPSNHSQRMQAANGTHPESFSHVIYSDDHGATWKLGGSAQSGTNESEVVELFDGKGTLILNMRSSRSHGRRRQALSSDGGSTWGETTDTTLIEPGCQGSILRLGSASSDHGTLLFSNPSDLHKRMNLTARASTDNAQTWSKGLVLAPGISAYSCLVGLDQSTAGCLYEGGPDRGSQQILFARFSITDAEAGQGH